MKTYILKVWYYEDNTIVCDEFLPGEHAGYIIDDKTSLHVKSLYGEGYLASYLPYHKARLLEAEEDRG